MNVNDLRARLTNIQMSLQGDKEQIKFTNAEVYMGRRLVRIMEVDYDADNNAVMLVGRE